MEHASGSANDVTFALAFNPAGQAVARTTTNPAYQHAPPTQGATPYLPDGLNQYDAVGGVGFVHDARGNLISDGVRTYAYDPENRLISVTQGSTVVGLGYDPLGRLRRIDAGASSRWFQWDGDRLISEYTLTGARAPAGFA